jgi:hypothetical protein
MGEQISTTDLYEGAFYLLGGCELVAVEGLRLNGGITCRLTFQGKGISRLQLEYFGGGVTVPLFPFRRAFGQVNALVYSAKKKAKNALRQEETGGAS